MVSCVTSPPGPCDSMEWVRYSPTASSTAATGPPEPPRLSTMAPLGTFQPAGALPQATSLVPEAPANAAPEISMSAAVRRVGKCMRGPPGRAAHDAQVHARRQPAHLSPFALDLVA